uniref:Uncharacterized protein n=1 Tax=Amphimedon queenslandica TaxID=400682 RepID=A0A1X7TUZ1_AMPQE
MRTGNNVIIILVPMATRFQQHHHILKARWRISVLHLLGLYSTTVASAAQLLVLSLLFSVSVSLKLMLQY